MSDADYGQGGRCQASLSAPGARNRASHTTWDMRTATVWAVRYPDDRNSVKWETTYDIVMHFPREKKLRVPVLRRKSSYEDGDEDTLHASFKSVAAGEKFDYRTADLAKLDGDVVAVQFLDGNENTPVIVGVLSHPRNTGAYRGARAGGEVRRVVHKGTKIEIDKDGNVTVTAAKDKNVNVAVSGTGGIVLAGGTKALALADHTHPIANLRDAENRPLADIPATQLGASNSNTDKTKAG